MAGGILPKRPFTRAQIRRFMFAPSIPYPEMIELVAQLKVRHGLEIQVINNEGRELNAYRIRKFKLDGFTDSFISSASYLNNEMRSVAI